MELIDRSNFLLREIEVRTNDQAEILFVPEEIFQLNELELSAVRRAHFPIKLHSELLGDGCTSVTQGTVCWKTKAEGVQLLMVFDLVNNVGFLHCLSIKVLDYASERFAISTSYRTLDKNAGATILLFEVGMPPFPDLELYPSLQELKAKSTLFKSLSEKDKNRITRPGNIEKLQGLVVAGNFGDNTARFIQHLYLGDFKNGKSTGIHHIYPILNGHAEIIKLTRGPDKFGVWEAIIRKRDKRSVYDKNIKPWKDKEEPSTFFPSNWNQATLMVELKFAFQNKTNPTESRNSFRWDSKTANGIPVEIWTDLSGNIVTIYPTYSEA